MRRVDPLSLQLFLAAAREGSIKRAADAEHIAQSALSRRIADLEHALGVQLLSRSPLGVTLTEAGQRAYALGEKLDADFQSFAREVQALSGEVAGTVRLFANLSSIVGFLPERLHAFKVEHPNVEIVLQERSSSECIRACLDDRADVAICLSGAATPPALESWHFADDPLIVILPPNHPLTKQRAIRFAELLRHPIVRIQSGGAGDSFVQEQAEKLRMPYMPVVAVSSYEAACRMVEVGMGVAIMTGSALRALAGTKRFVRRPLDEPWKDRELRVFALKKSSRLRAVDAMIAALRG
ncbi:LysR family transcriptional regulator [Variovorax sp. LjRoot84]|uniref:LysR family transcriptional regulator n=1 Tax=Variovorax TaxID=34072 RepID=UPI00285A914C|nr:LysR family transcriptional regulator [Variovorax guangxiensis]MDR6860198.1 DNA-binding transcriptional LysR family regulator [Variovorax guangxiensis]